MYLHHVVCVYYISIWYEVYFLQNNTVKSVGSWSLDSCRQDTILMVIYEGTSPLSSHCRRKSKCLKISYGMLEIPNTRILVTLYYIACGNDRDLQF